MLNTSETKCVRKRWVTVWWMWKSDERTQIFASSQSYVASEGRNMGLSGPGFWPSWKIQKEYETPSRSYLRWDNKQRVPLKTLTVSPPGLQWVQFYSPDSYTADRWVQPSAVLCTGLFCWHPHHPAAHSPQWKCFLAGGVGEKKKSMMCFNRVQAARLGTKVRKSRPEASLCLVVTSGHQRALAHGGSGTMPLRRQAPLHKLPDLCLLSLIVALCWKAH